MPRWSKTIRSRFRTAGKIWPTASPPKASLPDWPGPPARAKVTPRRGPRSARMRFTASEIPPGTRPERSSGTFSLAHA